MAIKTWTFRPKNWVFCIVCYCDVIGEEIQQIEKIDPEKSSKQNFQPRKLGIDGHDLEKTNKV